MRSYWISGAFSFLLSLGLLMVIMGQHREMGLIITMSGNLEKLTEEITAKVNNELMTKNSLDVMLVQAHNQVTDLEAKITQRSLLLETRRTTADTCETEIVRKKKFCKSFFLLCKTKNIENGPAAEWLNWKNEFWQHRTFVITCKQLRIIKCIVNIFRKLSY